MRSYPGLGLGLLVMLVLFYTVEVSPPSEEAPLSYYTLQYSKEGVVYYEEFLTKGDCLLRKGVLLADELVTDLVGCTFVEAG